MGEQLIMHRGQGVHPVSSARFGILDYSISPAPGLGAWQWLTDVMTQVFSR
jgi:hypothetical protein